MAFVDDAVRIVGASFRRVISQSGLEYYLLQQSPFSRLYWMEPLSY